VSHIWPSNKHKLAVKWMECVKIIGVCKNDLGAQGHLPPHQPRIPVFIGIVCGHIVD
jgi:hypothetical protein